MTTDKIVPPIVLFEDDGVHIYHSVEEIERHLEAWIVHEVPKFVGFDSQLNGLRLDAISQRRKVFGLFKLNEEKVKVRLDEAITVAGISDDKKEQLQGYLVNSVPSFEGVARLSAKEMLEKVLKTAVSK